MPTPLPPSSTRSCADGLFRWDARIRCCGRRNAWSAARSSACSPIARSSPTRPCAAISSARRPPFPRDRCSSRRFSRRPWFCSSVFISAAGTMRSTSSPSPRRSSSAAPTAAPSSSPGSRAMRSGSSTTAAARPTTGSTSMISGTRSVALLLLIPGVALAQTWELKELMRVMAEVPASRVRFVETRHIAMLTRPIELKGSLSYERPNRLAKHVESPFDELLTVDGESATLFNRTKGEQRFVSLREQPALGALVESVRATLAGDLPQLELHYRLEFSGTRGAWTLRLAPRDDKLKGYVETITLAGAGARLRRIETVEASGDRSVMRILHDAK